MSCQNNDISAIKGFSLKLPVSFSDGRNPIDISSWVIHFFVKSSYSDTAKLIEADFTIVNGPGGEALLTLASVNIPEGDNYVYRIYYTDTGNNFLVTEGIFKVRL